ncbi:MAG: hypothetical protein JJT99_02020 [Rhodobacteraceae bacterium]|nr:hypothetical protein [Paracoccaceae bacterium]
MKESRRFEINNEIETLQRGMDPNGNFWIGLGAFGIIATALGLQGDGVAAGLGIAVSIGLLLYGFAAKDKVKKSEEKIRILQKTLDLAKPNEK